MENKQTLWIVGGGVLVVALAVGLFYWGAPSKSAKQKAAEQPVKTLSMNEATNTVVMKTTKGEITIELYGKDAPKTVANFLKLAKDGFYAGTRFHRVIKGFMIQGGDPLSKDDAKMAWWGTGGPGYAFEDEFNGHKLVKGVLAMANSGPNTNGSQFFIVTAKDTPWLDGKHTAFGKVTSGIEVVEAIEAAKTMTGDKPLEPITLVSIDVK